MRILIGGLAAALSAMAQPTIRADNGVLNASSYKADIARGSWFVVFGGNMGPANIALASGAPFPTELSGTRVTFTPASGGTAVEARLWYTLAGQLAGLIPSTAAAGAYDVRVIYNGQTSAPRRVNVVERNFGFATVTQDGNGPAQATNASLNGGVSLVRFTTGSISFSGREWQYRPAYPGETLILWGTGIGADAQSDVNGGASGDQTAAGNIRVIVGTTEITPAYAGRSNGSPGLDQINFTLPASVSLGCTTSLSVRAGGRTSNLGSIAIAAAGAAQCTHPTLTLSQLTRLDQGGKLTAGSLGISKVVTKLNVPGFGSFDQTSESVSGAFSRYGVSQIADANFSLTQVNNCYVYRRVGDQASILTGSPAEALNAGAALTLNGPGASNKSVPFQSGAYTSLLYNSGVAGFGGSGTPTLAQGQYTMTGPGGPDIGSFTASINFPGSFTWTNEASIPAVVPRAQNLTVTWTGGGDGFVGITGSAGSQVGGTQTNPILDVAVFYCVAPASAGTFTVPSSILQQLPVVSGDVTSGAIGLLSVLATADPTKQGSFTAPLTAGGNVDFAFFTYINGTTKTVGYN
ncbi:MAG: hypothetical protein HYX27_15070 [Acidobacteria bacterium]|nr:hypothetical protein [Acidobacteriota bacterium]